MIVIVELFGVPSNCKWNRREQLTSFCNIIDNGYDVGSLPSVSRQ
jgi:hypothetical protein